MPDQHQDMHPVWPLLLQQQRQLAEQQQSACTLLRVGKSMAACLHAVAAGQMRCKVASSTCSGGSDDACPAEAAAIVRLQFFGRWLAKHGLLLQSLDLELPGRALLHVAIALQKAALASGPLAASSADKPPAHAAAANRCSKSSSLLQLQSFRGPLCASFLQQLPAHSLTSLVITDDQCGQTEDLVKAARVRQSLQHLTSLQRLVLIEDHETNTNLLVPALANMQQLTYLDIGIHRGRQEELQHLPASLRELNIGAVSNGFEQPDENWERPAGCLALGHLKALTKLSLVREVAEELLAIDLLPPGLEELQCCSVPSAEPLLHLQHLRLLSMGDTMPAAELQRLASSLTALQAVKLDYNSSTSAAAAAAGWSCLPVKSLHVQSEQDFDFTCLRHAAALTGLTGLHLHGWDPAAWTGSDLAAVLQELKQLEEVQLHGDGMQVLDFVPGTAHATQIVQALAGLPCLQSLQLAYVELGRQAATVLSGMLQLTRLSLQCCGLDDYEVNVLALHVTGLRALDVSYNMQVGDAVLPVIARSLQQLSSLQLLHTAMSRFGLHWVHGLRQLRELGVCCKLATCPELAGLDVTVDTYVCAVCPISE